MKNTIYTDGSCINNGAHNARAAWAVYHVQKKILLSGVVEDCHAQTNNTGELVAIMKAMSLLNHLGERFGLIISDSKYAISSISEWNVEKKVKGQKKANYELIKLIQSKLLLFHKLEFEWVKGHSIDPYNDLVDIEARRVIS